MNTDKLALFTIVTGPRGSDKTLYATSLACDRLLKSYIARTWPKRAPKWLGGPVYSNYPIGFTYDFGSGHAPVYLETKPLNMDALITFDSNLDNSWVFIDEIDIWADRQDWQNTVSKLLSKVFQQIRKKKMSLVATIQDLSWLNKRLQFQADIIVKCREAAFTPWGRERRLETGEIGFLSFMDKSGVLTGYTYEETGRVYNQIFQGKRFWHCFNTDYQFDVLSHSVKYKMKKMVKEIDLSVGEDGQRVEMQGAKIERDMSLLADLIDELKGKGEFKIPKRKYYEMATERGFKGTKVRMGRMMTDLGVDYAGRGQSEYNFERVI